MKHLFLAAVLVFATYGECYAEDYEGQAAHEAQLMGYDMEIERIDAESRRMDDEQRHDDEQEDIAFEKTMRERSGN